MTSSKVLVLPDGRGQGTGLRAAEEQMGLALSDIAGVGDAENDQVFLSVGYSAAVRNALSFLKKQVHYVTKATHEAGVEELIDKLLTGDSESDIHSPGDNVNSVL